MTDIAELLKQHTEGVELKLADYKQITEAMSGRLIEIEQKAAQGLHFGGGAYRSPSAGQMFVDNAEVKTFLENPQAGRRIGVETKAVITSATTDADGSAGDLINPQRDATYVGPQRRMTIRNLLPVVQVATGTIEYAKRTGFTNSADTVAEGVEKAQSELKYDLVTVPIRTIAHWVIASRQIMDDVPQLQGLIDTDLRYGLALSEEDQLLNGGGTGTDLNGLYTQATALGANPMVVATPTKIDAIAVALLQNALADHPPTGIIMHPSDWLAMRLIKDTAGAYILGDPGQAIEPRLFGIPVIATEAMTVDKFLVGDFRQATLYDRWSARVEISTEDGDNFRKNLITVLAEERIGLAVKDTTAFTKGDFSDTITDLTS